jgi:phage-related holin
MTSSITAKLLWASTLLMFEFLVNPSFSVFGVMLAVIFIDLVTGVVKAKFKKVNRTSEGYRKTLVKLLQYLVPVLILWGAGKFIPEYAVRLKQASGWVMMFIIYIEVTSIFENLYEIDKTSPISKYLYKNMLVILKFGLEKNAVQAAADKINQQKETEKPVV